MKIRYTIEPRWTHSTFSGEVEIDDEDLDGLSAEEREKLIEVTVGDAVNEAMPWGWEEVSE